MLYIYNCNQIKLDAKRTYLVGECVHLFSNTHKQVLFGM